MNEKEMLQSMFSAAKDDLMVFRRVFLPVEHEVTTPKFHEEWGEILLKGKRNYAIEGFRSSGKTGIVLRAFPFYCLTFPRKECRYIVFIMANQRLASKRLKEIEEEWLHNKLLSMNLVRVVEQSEKGFEVIVSNDSGEEQWVRFEAYGKGSSIRGLNVPQT